MTARRLEHGTPEGYDRGCTRHDRCPALSVHGLTCETAHIRFATGERRYMTLRARNLPAMAIAQRLGFAPPRPDPVDPIEEQIAAYAAAKAERDRVAAAAPETPGGGAAVDGDHLGATGAPARTAPGPTPASAPAVCPECAAGKHGNCDGAAWDLTADEVTTCRCPHPENTPDHQEQTMPKRKTEPTSTPATKPQPPTSDGSGRTKAERAEIRAWAEANGWTIGTTGRIPRDVIAAYDAAKASGEDVTPPMAPSPLTEAATTRFKELTETSADDVEAPALAAEESSAPGPVEAVGEYVYANASDALDETRVRADLPLATGDVYRIGCDRCPSSLATDRPGNLLHHSDGSHTFQEADGSVTVATFDGAPIDIGRPAWSQVTVSEDVERARGIAIRLEAENALILPALQFALEQWGVAADRANRASADLDVARSAVTTLLNRIEALERTNASASRALLAMADESGARAIAHASELSAARAEITRLNARRWWQR